MIAEDRSSVNLERWQEDEKKQRMSALRMVLKCRKWQEKLVPVTINKQITIMVKPGTDCDIAKQRFLTKYKNVI